MKIYVNHLEHQRFFLLALKKQTTVLWTNYGERGEHYMAGDCSLALAIERTSSHSLYESRNQWDLQKLEITNTSILTHWVCGTLLFSTKTNAVWIYSPRINVSILAWACWSGIKVLQFGCKAWTKYLMAVYEVETLRISWENVKERVQRCKEMGM